MQHLSATWLKKINYLFIVISAGLCAATYILTKFNVSPATQSRWGLTSTLIAMVAIHAFYVLAIAPIFAKQFTYLTYFIAFTIYGFFIVSLVEASGNTNIVYRLFFVGFMFLLTANGPALALGTLFLTWLTIIFTAAGVLTPSNASFEFNIFFSSLTSISGLLGWIMFKSHYVKKADKQALALESMLEQEQTKSSVILESITDGVVVINASGTIQVINQSAATILGWTQKDALRLDYHSLFEFDKTEIKPNQPPQDPLGLTLKSSKPTQMVSLIKTHHGRQVYIDIVASPIYQTKYNQEANSSEKVMVGVIAVLRDVDEQKRQEQQRSDFISTASHEMRTPVASIQGFLELALNPKVATVDEKAKGYLEKAHEATKHLGTLFQDLLTVSKSDDGRLNNHPTLIEIQEFLREIVEQDQMTANEKGLQLTFEQPQSSGKNVSPLMYVNVDPERLREVVHNLLENAVKYTPKGIVTVGASLKEQGVVIRVSDTGLGIAEEDIPHLFQKFYRTDNTATREIGGTGLGLYICRQIVELMGGTIWVESVLGTGSTFYVEIPRVSPDKIPTTTTPVA